MVTEKHFISIFDEKVRNLESEKNSTVSSSKRTWEHHFINIVQN